MKRQTVIKNLYKKAQSKVIKLANGEYAINAGRGKHFLSSSFELEADSIQWYLKNIITHNQYETEIAFECLENSFPEIYGDRGKTTLGDLIA